MIYHHYWHPDCSFPPSSLPSTTSLSPFYPTHTPLILFILPCYPRTPIALLNVWLWVFASLVDKNLAGLCISL